MTYLEQQLRGSLALLEMQKALREAIPLLRQQQESLSHTVALLKQQGSIGGSFAFDATQSEHDEWLQALMHCQAALKGASTPLVVVEEVWS